MNKDQTQEAGEKLQQFTKPQVTEEIIEALMEKVEFATGRIDGTTVTLATAIFAKEWTLCTEYSACIDPERFDADEGEQIALQKCRDTAYKKLWELEGYYVWKMHHLRQALQMTKLLEFWECKCGAKNMGYQKQCSQCLANRPDSH